METKEIKELLKAFDDSGSSYLRIKQDGVDIQLRKPDISGQPVIQPVSQQVVVAPEEVVAERTLEKPKAVDGVLVKAPLVGVFYSAPSPEEKPYVQVGDSVKSGQVLCLIEAMKMMSEITAPSDGVIKEIYAKNQDVVEFEQELFLIGD
ncbi:acetyl-CoA carboxylase biotin carboxyl carrier protein [Pseudobutyrivibrio xylanivorans]|uniref:Biotin carboxyl carrier protein of acetyl-CoA carboxylase n=1 Tax=Pseudobutyrivibrio xylanivorans TaxID=185007 RepID=A0A5P6VMD3_PSEXY|nr:acetyl-CoA carboxylase biotin carboxyl carrier protein [Pseudobutyrivibrio xylanivorans]QFJ53813.1 acetyl-CoA carboxylase biotin carboxyl carrier protein [Pseudobutyrivibrio xylanivorans]